MQRRFLIVLILFFKVVLAENRADNLYLFSETPIPLRSEGKLKSKITYTLQPGESFEVLKWNNILSKVRLPDGSIYFIERSLIENFAPNDNNGFLIRPLNLTVTSDETKLIKQKNTLGDAFAPRTGNNAEFTENSEKVQLAGGDDSSVHDDDVVEDLLRTPELFKEMGRFSSLPGRLTPEKDAALSSLGLVTWKNAIEKRRKAGFLGKGWVSGNRSKGRCATAVRESLVDSGLCSDYSDNPDAIDAVNLHAKDLFKNRCPGLHLAKDATQDHPLTVDDIAKAPGGSVIVYSGYAGKTKHNHGHVEIKIPVTQQLIDKMGKNGLGVEVGDFLYCSDYCTTMPTKRKTNEIEAIYTL